MRNLDGHFVFDEAEVIKSRMSFADKSSMHLVSKFLLVMLLGCSTAFAQENRSNLSSKVKEIESDLKVRLSQHGIKTNALEYTETARVQANLDKLEQVTNLTDLFYLLEDGADEFMKRRASTQSSREISDRFAVVGQNTHRHVDFDEDYITENSFDDTPEGNQLEANYLFLKGLQRAIRTDPTLSKKYSAFKEQRQAQLNQEHRQKIAKDPKYRALQFVTPQESVAIRNQTQDDLNRKYDESTKWINTGRIAPIPRAYFDMKTVFNSVYNLDNQAGPQEWSKALDGYFKLKGEAVKSMDSSTRFKNWTYLHNPDIGSASHTSPQASSKLLAQVESQIVNDIAAKIIDQSKINEDGATIKYWGDDKNVSTTSQKTAKSTLTFSALSEKLEDASKRMQALSESKANSQSAPNGETPKKPAPEDIAAMQTLAAFSQVTSCLETAIDESVKGIQPSEISPDNKAAITPNLVSNFDLEVKSNLIECIEPLLSPAYFSRDSNGKRSFSHGKNAPKDTESLQAYLSEQLLKNTTAQWARVKTRHIRGEELAWGDRLFMEWERLNKGTESEYLPKDAFTQKFSTEIHQDWVRLKNRYNLSVRSDECAKNYADTSASFHFGDFKTIQYTQCPQVVLKDAQVFLPNTKLFEHPEDLAAIHDFMGPQRFASFILTNIYLAKINGIPFPLFKNDKQTQTTLNTLNLLLCAQQTAADVEDGVENTCQNETPRHPGLSALLNQGKDFYEKIKVVQREGKLEYFAPNVTIGDNPNLPLFSTKKPYVLEDSTFVLQRNHVNQFDYIDYTRQIRALVDETRQQERRLSSERVNLQGLGVAQKAGVLNYAEGAFGILVRTPANKILKFFSFLEPKKTTALYNQYVDEMGQKSGFEHLRILKNFATEAANIDSKTLDNFDEWLKNNDVKNGGTAEFRSFEKAVQETSDEIAKLLHKFRELGVNIADDTVGTDVDSRVGPLAQFQPHFTDVYAQVASGNRMQHTDITKDTYKYWLGDPEKYPDGVPGVIWAGVSFWNSYELGAEGNATVATGQLLSTFVSVRPTAGATFGLINGGLESARVLSAGSKVKAISAFEKSLSLAKNLGKAETYEQLGALLKNGAKNPVVSTKNLWNGTIQSGKKFGGLVKTGIVHPIDSTKAMWGRFGLSDLKTKQLAGIWNVRSENSTFNLAFNQGHADGFKNFFMMKGFGAASSTVGLGMKNLSAAIDGSQLTTEEQHAALEEILQSIIGGNSIRDIAFMNTMIRGGDALQLNSSKFVKNIARRNLTAEEVAIIDKRIISERLAASQPAIKNFEQRSVAALQNGNHSQSSRFLKFANDLKTKALTAPTFAANELRIGNIIGNIPTTLYFNGKTWGSIDDQRQEIAKKSEMMLAQADQEESRDNKDAARKLRKQAKEESDKASRLWATLLVGIGTDFFMTYKFMKHETWNVQAFKPERNRHQQHIKNTVAGFIKKMGLVNVDGRVEMTPDQYKTLATLMRQENKKFTNQLDKYLVDSGAKDPQAMELRGATFLPFTVGREENVITNNGTVDIYVDNPVWMVPTVQAPPVNSP